jgi:hypothetical protein
MVIRGAWRYTSRLHVYTLVGLRNGDDIYILEIMQYQDRRILSQIL